MPLGHAALALAGAGSWRGGAVWLLGAGAAAPLTCELPAGAIALGAGAGFLAGSANAREPLRAETLASVANNPSRVSTRPEIGRLCAGMPGFSTVGWHAAKR